MPLITDEQMKVLFPPKREEDQEDLMNHEDVCPLQSYVIGSGLPRPECECLKIERTLLLDGDD